MSTPSTALPDPNAARIPLPGDNVAVACRRLNPGDIARVGDVAVTLRDSVMEGHRFALLPIGKGELLLSWNKPFGHALRDIAAGEYICNQGMLDSLRPRKLDFALPAAPNFFEQIEPYRFDEAAFRPAPALPPAPNAGRLTFPGYLRAGGRGVGVRNLVVLLGVSSRVAAFVRRLEERFRDAPAAFPGLDGVVAVAHTEGDTPGLHNRDFILRALGGLAVHPNAHSVLLVDAGDEPVNGAELRSFLAAQRYPLEAMPHAWFTMSGGFEASLDRADKVVRAWLPAAAAERRTPQPVGALNIGMQCGGSDAFSGISANPLIAWGAREVIRHGGAANVAETDELIGAEPYILDKVRDADTARGFLRLIEEFKERAGWHGASAEGNPTGGNKYRGLYNIQLKSIGAGMKKSPDTRLDHAIRYAERMIERGFYFMDSPGNDLESVTGQVACGCQIMYFTTGNGSVTNHPLAPTIKVVTTTRRYQLLSNDMDVNAGEYLDGTPMDTLGQRLFDLTLAVAGGQRTIGEKAGHSQVQIWRNWALNRPDQLQRVRVVTRLSGDPIALAPVDAPAPAVRFPAWFSPVGPAAEQVALIMPTSLCAGSVAQMAARRFNAEGFGRAVGISRFVTLPHTEGCCVSQNAERLYQRTLLGCITHPSVRHCLLLEHGCEVTHNDYMRDELASQGMDVNRYGWASIQLDGGIDKVSARLRAWFEQRFAADPGAPAAPSGLEGLRLAFLSDAPVPAGLAASAGAAFGALARAGGAAVVPEGDALLSSAAFTGAVAAAAPLDPTLAYAQPLRRHGAHVMACTTANWNERLTGLAATGVHAVLAFVATSARAGTPLVPVLQVADPASAAGAVADDVDLMADRPSAEALLALAARTLAGERVATARRHGNEDFQISRGLLSVTL